MPKIPSREKAGTEDCSNTEALGEIGGEAIDDEEGAEITLLIKVVVGTARADIVETEGAMNSGESEVLDKANIGFCLISKSF